jgi:hypothetical protein
MIHIFALRYIEVFFGDKEYILPVTVANPFGTWHQFCWSLLHLRENSDCAFCELVLSTLNLLHDFKILESGIVTVRKEACTAKRKRHRFPICFPQPGDLGRRRLEITRKVRL